MPKTSIIIPVRNGAAFLKEAIDSALAQTLPPHEIIVVDDGSTDATRAVVEPYLREQKIIYLYQGQAGVAAARNRGIRAATGEFIAFLDADDRWLPEKLERQLPLFDRPEVGLVYSEMTFVGNRSGPFSQIIPRGYQRGNVVPQLIRGNFPPTSSIVVRSSALKQAGGFLEDPKHLSIAEDYHLWLRIALSNEFDFISDPLVEYRVHPGQTTGSARREHRCLRFMFKTLLHDEHFRSYRGALRRQYFVSSLKYVIDTILGR